MNKLFWVIALSALLMSGAAFAADTAPATGENNAVKTELPKAEPSKPAPQERQVQTEATTAEERALAKDTCGGAGNYMGLRVLGKDETLAPGSRKVDLNKLPAGTRVFDGSKPHPEANGSNKDANPKRLNLIIDRRNVIAEAFCG